MSNTDRSQKWWEYIGAGILLAAATIGGIYDIVHRFKGEHYIPASPEEVLIILVTLLCGGIGAERLITLRKIESGVEETREHGEKLLRQTHLILQGLKKLQSEVVEDFKGVDTKIDAVSKINKTESLIGTKAIEVAAQKLVNDSGDNDHIKATSQYSAEDSLSSNYLKAVLDRVKKASENQGEMEYHVIRPAKSDSENETEDKRRDLFKDREIEDRYITRYANNQWPFEVLIVGHSMIIALRGGRKRPTYEAAIKITDAEFVKKALEWYNEIALRDQKKLMQ